MPKKTLAALASAVQEHGLPPNTPAIAIMDATLATQQIIRGTIADLPARMTDAKLEGPVTVIIGQALT